jgi:hypothetical protein
VARLSPSVPVHLRLGTRGQARGQFLGDGRTFDSPPYGPIGGPVILGAQRAQYPAKETGLFGVVGALAHRSYSIALLEERPELAVS